MMTNLKRTQPIFSSVDDTVPTVAARLGAWDAASIIIGIVVGTAIFKSPPSVFQNSAGPWQAMLVWILGGLLSLIGALCYAELATTYPRSGGDYEYLGRAYGRWLGFLFGWAQLAVILTGSIGAMAYAFADYGQRLWTLPDAAIVWLAAAAVVGLSLTNLAGIVAGKWMQNVLTTAKVLGLLLVVLAGWLGSSSATSVSETAHSPIGPGGFGLAMVFVLYAFGGWNDAAFVAAEVRDRRRNLPKALFLGLFGITLIYLLVNAAYLRVLGFEGARQSATPASDVLESVLGNWGSKSISLLVMISALGAINGMTLTGSRIYVSLGKDHRLFAWLGQWNQRLSAPVGALVAQGLVALLLIFAVGTESGHLAMNRLAAALNLKPLPGREDFGGFETLVAGTAPVFWSFFLLTGISVFILRYRDPDRPRPFTMPLYPLPPILFCATCIYMLYSSVTYAGSLALLGGVPLAIGVPLYILSCWRKRMDTASGS
ncbi:MAG: amino acid permease [Pirellulales bacterium]|nr:amino acid permease [Pirellulales bacterium]